MLHTRQCNTRYMAGIEGGVRGLMGCWDTKVFFGPPEQGLSVRQESIVDRAALAPSPKVCAHRMRAPESTRCWDIVVTSYSSCVLPKTKRRVLRDSAWPLSTCQYLCERLLHTPTLSCLGLGKSVILPPPHAYGLSLIHISEPTRPY